MTVLVSFCCNDDRGDYTGRVAEVQIGEDIHLVCRCEPPSAMKITTRPRYRHVQVGRRAFICGDWTPWVGNIYWDATTMKVAEARRLVAYLLHIGWAVEQWAHEGPFADLARSAS